MNLRLTSVAHIHASLNQVMQVMSVAGMQVAVISSSSDVLRACLVTASAWSGAVPPKQL
jgi:hypothetical protein